MHMVDYLPEGSKFALSAALACQNSISLLRSDPVLEDQIGELLLSLAGQVNIALYLPVEGRSGHPLLQLEQEPCDLLREGLSGGVRRRAVLVRALAVVERHPILVADELLQIPRTKFESFPHRPSNAHPHVLVQELLSEPIRVADLHPELHSNGLADELGVRVSSMDKVAHDTKKGHQLRMSRNDKVESTQILSDERGALPGQILQLFFLTALELNRASSTLKMLLIRQNERSLPSQVLLSRRDLFSNRIIAVHLELSMDEGAC